MSRTDFRLFGLAHVLILFSVPVIAWALARIGRGDTQWKSRIRISLACFLAINEVVWYTYRYSSEGIRFPEGLPLQLCDLMVWLTAAALLSLKQWVLESAYLVGIAGAGMALITPDLWAPLLSYPSIYFFLVHGGIVIALLYLVWADFLRLGRRSVWRVLAAVNAYACLIGAFNAAFGTNYMYLCRKPGGASVLDWFGPWPVYLIAGEVLAAALLWLLWLPSPKSMGK